MKKKLKVGLLLALACLVMVNLGACARQAEEGQRQLVKVKRGDLAVTVNANGALSFVGDRKLVFGISGTIAEVNVAEGDRVSQGKVLASLDTTSLKLAAETAKVDLDIATNSYTKLTYPYSPSTFAINVPTALAAVVGAEAALNEVLKSLTLELSFDQYSQVQQQLKKAQDNLTKAEEMLGRGQGGAFYPSNSGVDFWTIRATQLGMEKAQVALDKANADLEKAVIVAPFDGVVAAVNVKVGDTLSAVDYSTRTIVELIDPRKMELSAEVDEIDVPNVKLGQRAIIIADALPDVKLQGEVTFVSPVATEILGLKLYNIKVDFEVPEGSELKAGMSATVNIVTNERSGVLLVPNRAIKQDSQGKPVVNVMVNGEIKEKAVVIGITDSSQTEIVSGLSEGDTVVIL